MSNGSPARPPFDGLGADFPAGDSGLPGLVADGRAMRLRTVLDLPAEPSHPAPPATDVRVPDSTVDLLAELGGYGA